MIEFMLISEMTEDELISSFLPFLPTSSRATVPSGDDSAVLKFEGATAVSVDLLMEDRHFLRTWSTGRDVGFRAAMQNLADAVAMGAQPVTLVVGLALPSDLDSAWLTDFARGLSDACEPLGVGVDGGDLVGGDKIAVSVTVLGDMEGREPVLRSGAQPGDRIILAGNLGHGAGGFALLEAGYTRDDENLKLSGLVDDFLRPKPPLEIALAAARSGELHTLMDVSDGLIRDARRMAKSSGVWMDVNKRAVESKLGDLAVAAGRLKADRREWLFTGGEDHGFLATMSPSANIPPGFIDIGEVQGPFRGGRVTVSGADIADGGGWDHFLK